MQFEYREMKELLQKAQDLVPDWEKNRDQMYSCPRDWRLSTIMRAQLKRPPETPRTSQYYSIEGIKDGTRETLVLGCEFLW